MERHQNVSSRHGLSEKKKRVEVLLRSSESKEPTDSKLIEPQRT